MKTFQEVVQWMRERKVLNRYCKYTCKYHDNEEEHLDLELYYSNNLNDLINRGFMWSGTPEGHAFWCEVHNDFCAWFGSASGDGHGCHMY